MDVPLLGFLIIACSVIGVFAFLQSPVDSAIPPTPAFSMINTTNGNVTANTYNTMLTFLGSGVTITPDYNNTSITFTVATTSNSAKIDNQTAKRDFQIIGINNVTGVITTNQFSVNTKNCLTAFINSIDNQTGNVTCATATSSSLKVNNQTVSANFYIAGINNVTGVITTKQLTTSSLKVDNQTQTKGKFITGINNSTGAITTQTFKVNNQTQTKGKFITGINNSTGAITTQTFKALTKTCSGTDKFSSYDNQTGVLTCTTDQSGSGGTTVLSSNVTATTGSTKDTLIWTIPLTANSGNTVSGVLTATSGITGNAVRAAGNVTDLGTKGFCHWVSVATTTTDSIDNIVMNTVLTGRATNNAETLWIAAANVAQPINFQCSLSTGATPGNLKIWMSPEIDGTTINVKAGSFYIKTP